MLTADDPLKATRDEQVALDDHPRPGSQLVTHVAGRLLGLLAQG